jgi:hypothetical protein
MDRGFGAVLVEDAEFISALFSSQDFGKGGQRGPVIPLLRVQFTTAYKNLETKRSQEAINLASLHLCPRFCNWEANFMKMGAKGDQNGFFLWLNGGLWRYCEKQVFPWTKQDGRYILQKSCIKHYTCISEATVLP